jgi:hypothetical protein
MEKSQLNPGSNPRPGQLSKTFLEIVLLCTLQRAVRWRLFSLLESMCMHASHRLTLRCSPLGRGAEGAAQTGPCTRPARQGKGAGLCISMMCHRRIRTPGAHLSSLLFILSFFLSRPIHTQAHTHALTMWKVPRPPPPLRRRAVRPKVWRNSLHAQNDKEEGWQTTYEAPTF